MEETLYPVFLDTHLHLGNAYILNAKIGKIEK